MCISCGHLQAADFVSEFAEHSARLQRCRPTTLHVVTCSVWQQLHGKVFLCNKDKTLVYCGTLLPKSAHWYSKKSDGVPDRQRCKVVWFSM